MSAPRRHQERLAGVFQGCPRYIILLFLSLAAFAQDRPAIREALTDLNRGDFAGAERVLRPDVQAHPSDAAALTLLGVALDQLGKSADADEIHRRAVASAPRNVDVLTNYGNHLAGAGKPEEARKVYLQVVAIDPKQLNANAQLARLAIGQKNGAEALTYLKNIAQDAPPIEVLRLAALTLAGDRPGAEAVANRLASTDLAANFSIGLALANLEQYETAESFFNKALAAAPTDFNVLVNLGVVASKAGHPERGRELLESALRQQPENVDLLYNLVLVNVQLHQTEAALRLLVQAQKLAPQRADVQKMLAIVTGDLGALEDAAAAWDRYVRLAPNDDFGRRERGFNAILMGKFEQGLPELEWFVQKHPDDPVGHFELGQAKSKDEPAKGLAELDRAIALNPEFPAARAFRGGLYYQSGKFEAALADLEVAARLRPNDAVTLDRLGQTYSSLERPADAVRTLRRAVELAPDDSKTMLHYARALADNGNAAESKEAMDKFRKLGPVSNKSIPGGLVDYLALTPEQQRADYRGRVEKAAAAAPNDASVLVNLLKLQLEDGKVEQAVVTAKRIATLKPAPTLLADAGRALLESRQYEPARQLLDQSGDPGAALDLAVASDLAKGQFMAALKRAPERVDLYQSAMAELVKQRQYPEALALLARAPQNREILVLRAVVLELAGKPADADRQVADIQNRWPEWFPGWVADGFVLERHGRTDEARKALETAAALGAHTRSAPPLALFFEKPPKEW